VCDVESCVCDLGGYCVCELSISRLRAACVCDVGGYCVCESSISRLRAAARRAKPSAFAVILVVSPPSFLLYVGSYRRRLPKETEILSTLNPQPRDRRRQPLTSQPDSQGSQNRISRALTPRSKRRSTRGGAGWKTGADAALLSSGATSSGRVLRSRGAWLNGCRLFIPHRHYHCHCYHLPSFPFSMTITIHVYSVYWNSYAVSCDMAAGRWYHVPACCWLARTCLRASV